MAYKVYTVGCCANPNTELELRMQHGKPILEVPRQLTRAIAEVLKNARLVQIPMQTYGVERICFTLNTGSCEEAQVALLATDQFNFV